MNRTTKPTTKELQILTNPSALSSVLELCRCYCVSHQTQTQKQEIHTNSPQQSNNSQTS